jgi:uncharacterized membrane protein (DUF485 family)
MSLSPTTTPPDDPELHLPKDHWPLPRLSQPEPTRPHPTAKTFADVKASPEYQKLRRSFVTFAFPTVAAVLVWYFLYVLLSLFAVKFMSLPAIGYLNVGMVIGLAQFPTTWFATWLYVRRASRVLDPMAASVRATIEAEVSK